MGVNTGPDNSYLLMDLGVPLGNSDDTFGKQALHVKVGNKASEPIPVTFTPASTGEVKNFYSEQVTAAGGGTVSLISQTVPVGKTWLLGASPCSCRFEATFAIKVNSVVKWKIRTGPGQATVPFSFTPVQPIQEGDSIDIEVTTGSYVPQTDASTTLMLTET